MKKVFLPITLVFLLLAFIYSCSFKSQTEEISQEDLRDMIYGGILGQFFGNLNGLIHEHKYEEDPGNVTTYVPDLSEGAHTDDDTDIEFVYIYHMAKEDKIILPYEQIKVLWEEFINNYIYSSNRYARNLMKIGFEPPYTGRIAFNPRAIYNISGQFLCEQFALIAPGMPQTASKIGTHYTHVAIDGEPTQTTQLYNTMIAHAFFEKDHLAIIDAGLMALDPKSEIHQIVSDVKKWYLINGNDWRATRQAIKSKYWNGARGGPSGGNGYRTITAVTVAALLHGEGDFVESIRLAFNLGWDADNTAAMVGTIMGVIKGEKWIRNQGWEIKDEYRNNRRPGMPTDLTIGDFADLHVEIAQRLILANGGEKIKIKGVPGYRIKIQKPSNIEKLPEPLHRIEEMRKYWWPIILRDIEGEKKARAAYAAICLDMVSKIVEVKPDALASALDALEPHYDRLYGNKQWSDEAHQYFVEVVKNRNLDARAPFGY